MQKMHVYSYLSEYQRVSEKNDKVSLNYVA